MRFVKDAGTAIGLAERLGASQARTQGFALSNPAEARRRAVVDALAAAHIEGEAIAAASGMRLGEVISVVDGTGIYDILVSAQRAAEQGSFAFAPPSPVTVDITPAPVRTEVRLTVTYALVK